MRRSAMLLVVVSTACFSDPPVVGDDSTASSSDASTGGMQSKSSSASTGSTGVDPASSDASGDATTVVVAECGNGNVEVDEPCDDGNDDDLDGCTSDCIVGPIGLLVVPDVSPTPAGQGEMVDTASCGDHGTDRALGSLFGELGGPDVSDTWPTSIGGSCQQLHFSAQGDTIAIEGTPIDPDLPVFGDPGGQGPWSLLCPAGELPVGIRGRYYIPEPPYFKSLALMCAEATVRLDIGPPRVRTSMPQPTVATPSNGSGEEVTVICPIDTIAIGFQGRATDAPSVDSIGPLCARIELVLP